MVQIELTESKFSKNPKTKTSYILESKETKLIDERQHGLITSDDTCKWFRRKRKQTNGLHLQRL